jgi:antitoxin (DNA-binding transcriptional repressor) of toxin-antitoxin stability system
MPDISMLDLRSNLSAIVRDVEAGHTYTVKRFGKTVMMLVPAGTVVDIDPTLAYMEHIQNVHDEGKKP